MKALSHIHNIVWNYGGIIALTLTTLIGAPVFIYYMGDDGFGLFRLTIYSIISFAFLLEIGASAALKRIIGATLNQQDLSGAKTTLILGFALFAILSLITLAIAVKASGLLAQLLAIDEANIVVFTRLITISGIYLGVLFLQTPLNALSYAIGRFDYLQLPKVGLRILQLLALPFMALFVSNASIAGGYATLVAAILSLLLSCYLPRRELRKIFSEGKFRPSAAVVKEFFSLSGYSLLIAIAPVFLYYGADFAVARYHGAASVAFFSIATIVASQVRGFISGALSPGFSSASKLATSEDMDRLAALVKKLLRYGIGAWALFSLPLIFFSEQIISVWVGESYSYYWRLTVIQLFGVAGVALYLSIYTVMNAMGHLRGMAVISVSCVGLAACSLYVIGENGLSTLAGIAMCIAATLLLRGALSVMFASKVFGSGIHRYTATLLLKTISIMMLNLMIYVLLQVALSQEHLIQLIIGLPVISVINMGLCAVFFMTKSEMTYMTKRLAFIGKVVMKTWTT